MATTLRLNQMMALQTAARKQALGDSTDRWPIWALAALIEGCGVMLRYGCSVEDAMAQMKDALSMAQATMRGTAVLTQDIEEPSDDD